MIVGIPTSLVWHKCVRGASDLHNSKEWLVLSSVHASDLVLFRRVALCVASLDNR